MVKKTHGYLNKIFRLCCCIYSIAGRYSSKGHLKVRRLFIVCGDGELLSPLVAINSALITDTGIAGGVLYFSYSMRPEVDFFIQM